MHISLTKKVIDFIEVVDLVESSEDDFFSWHANYFIHNRKNLFVITNDLTRFSIVLYGVKKKELLDFLPLMKEAIFVTMAREEYEPMYILKYLEGSCDKVSFGRSKNRKLVANNNRASIDLSYIVESGIDSNLIHEGLAHKLNSTPVNSSKTSTCYYPNKKMKEYLELYCEDF